MLMDDDWIAKYGDDDIVINNIRKIREIAFSTNQIERYVREILKKRDFHSKKLKILAELWVSNIISQHLVS